MLVRPARTWKPGMATALPPKVEIQQGGSDWAPAGDG